MQKWEYKLEEFEQIHDGQLLECLPPELVIEQMPGPKLRKLGNEGWELVNVVVTEREGNSVWKMFFKRPKNDME